MARWLHVRSWRASRRMPRPTRTDYKTCEPLLSLRVFSGADAVCEDFFISAPFSAVRGCLGVGVVTGSLLAIVHGYTWCGELPCLHLAMQYSVDRVFDSLEVGPSQPFSLLQLVTV